MDIKLIALDLDGTALQNDHISFTPRLDAALEKAYAQGVIITPVTGRQFGLLPPPMKSHPVWSDLIVLCNGGQIRRLESGECLYDLGIPGSELQKLLDLTRRLDIPIEFSVEGKLYLTRRSYDMQLPVPNLHFHRDTILAENGIFVDTLEPMCKDGSIEKVNLPYLPEGIRPELEEALKSIDVSAVWASGSSMEITHSAATKGNGLKAVCRLLDIPLESVMALGDSGNDVTMLKLAGLGIAMGNAPDFVKAAADVITDSNVNDGAAKAIEEFAIK